MDKNINLLFLFIIYSFISTFILGQSFVSVTIDDVPNTIKYQKDNFQSKLMNELDSLNIPVTIFVNEELLLSGDSVSQNNKLLENWIKLNYVTVGNHTFNHSRYSDVGFDAFINDIENGEKYSKPLAEKYNKPLKYFRFPYNDLGKDSLEHTSIEKYLTSKGYISTPFTIESSDWVYNYIYEYYQSKNEYDSAKAIGQKYVTKTMEYFDYYESVALQLYGRKVKHIYLCHDNSINADYLSLLVRNLQNKNYSFISLDATLQDNIYKQTDIYYKKWGISWLFRWIKSSELTKALMKKEPEIDNIYNLYESLLKKSSEKTIY